MKVAVTGASGFIGMNLVRHLIENNYQVVPIIRNEKKRKEIKEEFAVKPIVCDIQDFDGLVNAFQNVDAVIHLAALFNNPENTWSDYEDVNIEGTMNVLKAACGAGVKKVIHCSTIGVAIDSGEMPYSEDSPYSFPENDKYENTKYQAEKAALEYHEKNNYPVTIIRPAQVYGPGDVSKVKFYKMVKKGIIVRPKKTMKHLIYIDDLCRAFILALESKNVDGEVIIIGQDSAISLNDMIEIAADKLNVQKPKIMIPQRPIVLVASLVEKLSNLVGIKPPIFKRSMDFFVRSVVLDVSKAKRLLNFESKVSVKEGIEKTVNWYINNGLLFLVFSLF